jgi:hypothetical protein
MTIAKHTLTVYNKYIEGVFNPPNPPSQQEKWNRTVIRFGQWEDRTDRNFTQAGATLIDKHIEVIIPKTANTGGKKFVKSLEWGKFETAQKIQTWTVRAEDYVVLGEGPEIAAGYTMDNLRADFRHCMVKAIEDLSDQPVLPHWEISGI